MDRIRIGAFDEKPLFLAGLIHVLNAEPGMQVVAEGGSASEALRLSREPPPDVVILDANLLDQGFSSIAALSAEVKILISTFSANETQVHAAFAAGARGYVLKGVTRHELLEAVRAVYRGEGYVSPALAAEIMLSHAGHALNGKNPNANPIAQLSHREDQIFKLLAAGLKNREIGTRLTLSEKSIKRYVTTIFEKLNVRNRVEAALLAGGGSGRESPKSTPCAASGKGLYLPHASVRAPLPGTQPNNIRAGLQDGSGTVLPPPKPATAHSFSAVFGRSWTPVQQAKNEPGKTELGTHIVL